MTLTPSAYAHARVQPPPPRGCLSTPPHIGVLHVLPPLVLDVVLDVVLNHVLDVVLDAAPFHPHRCGLGNFCPAGSAAPTPCPAGTYGDPVLRTMTSASECLQCQPGTWCSVGSLNASSCAPGTYSAQAGQEKCTKCEAGTYQQEEGATGCKVCESGSFCEEGAAAALPCPAGTRTDLTLPVMTSAGDCVRWAPQILQTSF